MSTVTTLPTIDDLLGPAGDRYFGAGYRRTVHRLTDLRIEPRPGGGGDVSATAKVEYPPGWSCKSGATAAQPHLSSVDGLLFAVELAEAFLTHTLGLDGQARRLSWLRLADLRAGSAPLGDLGRFRVTASASPTGVADGGPALPGGLPAAITAFDCAIGSMRVRCELVHPAGASTAAPGSYPEVSQLLGDGGTRYHAGGFRRWAQRVDQVEFDQTHRWARADLQVLPDLRVLPQTPTAAPTGLGAAYAPTGSMIDYLVALAQVSQVLLYRVDGIERGQSNTLWMRRITIAAATPRLPTATAVSLQVTKCRLVVLGGQTWRLMDITSDPPGLRGSASFAHALPPAGADPDQHHSRTPDAT